LKKKREKTIPPKHSAMQTYGKISKGFNPTNQTMHTGNISEDQNPQKFLRDSIELKEP
jgi:hypothetical protein